MTRIARRWPPSIAKGGFGYGEIKKALADLAVDYFAEARERRHSLEAHPEKVREILARRGPHAPAKRQPKCCSVPNGPAG